MPAIEINSGKKGGPEYSIYLLEVNTRQKHYKRGSCKRRKGQKVNIKHDPSTFRPIDDRTHRFWLSFHLIRFPKRWGGYKASRR